MFLKTKTSGSMKNFSDNDKIVQIAERIKEADAIIIGAGAGLSTSAGLTYSGERFEKNFADIAEIITNLKDVMS